MHAAVVSSFARPPRFEEVPGPVATGPDEVVVTVLGAALHPRVRSQADGSHYTSTAELPLVPGFDGVGRTDDGALVYFVLPDTARGSMAERVVIDRRRAVPLPTGADPLQLAAAMNPAMSSWVALRRRTRLEPGQGVLVLGATGSAGRLAVQVAKHLGARRVVAAGRAPERLAELPALGADRVLSLTDDPEELGAACAEAGVDVVLDYLWGTVATQAIPAVLTARPDRGRPLTWIEVGSMAGLEVPVRSEWLRAARIALVGSGQGSVPTRDIVAELGELAAHVGAGGCQVDVVPTPLAGVEAAWTAPHPGAARVVLVP